MSELKKTEDNEMNTSLNNWKDINLELCTDSIELDKYLEDYLINNNLDKSDEQTKLSEQIKFLDGYMCVRSTGRTGTYDASSAMRALKDELEMLKEIYLNGTWRQMTGKYDNTDYDEIFNALV